MTDLNLDAIEARANAATDGPWGYPFAGKNRITTPVDIDITEADWGGENLREYVLSCLDDRNAWRAADAEFIAHARSDVPALVAEVRRLRERTEAHAVTVQQAVSVERQRDEARAERDAYLAALSAIASMPSASIAVRDVARHALLNGGAS